MSQRYHLETLGRPKDGVDAHTMAGMLAARGSTPTAAGAASAITEGGV